MNTPERSFPWKGVFIGCGAITVVGFILICAGFLFLLSGPEGGVRLGNEMEEYAIQYLDEHQLLNPTETLIAYYDVTLSLDGTEAAILTTERVIYHKNGRSTSIQLSDITEIRHRDEGLIGDVIEIDSQNGVPMKFEISPFNQGETFLNALQTAYERSQ